MKENEIGLLEMVVNVLNNIIEKCPYSDEFLELQVGEKFFEDSCKFVDMHQDIRELRTTLRNMVKYFKILQEDEAR